MEVNFLVRVSVSLEFLEVIFIIYMAKKSALINLTVILYPSHRKGDNAARKGHKPVSSLHDSQDKCRGLCQEGHPS